MLSRDILQRKHVTTSVSTGNRMDARISWTSFQVAVLREAYGNEPISTRCCRASRQLSGLTHVELSHGPSSGMSPWDVRLFATT